MNDQTLSEKGLQQVVDAESLNRWAQGGLDARKVAASDDQLLRQKQVEGTVDGVGHGVTAVGRCVDLARCVGRNRCVGRDGCVDRNRCVSRGRCADPDDTLERLEIGNIDDGTLTEEELENVIVVDGDDARENLRLAGDSVVPVSQKVVAGKAAETVVDDIYTASHRCVGLVGCVGRNRCVSWNRCVDRDRRVSRNRCVGLGRCANSDNTLERLEIGNADDGTLTEKELKNVIVVDGDDARENLRLAGDSVVPVSQKVVAGKAAETVVDDIHSASLADAIERALNAAVASGRNVETVLAREDLASSIATDAVDVGDILAVLAVRDVVSERRGNSATAT